MFRNSDVVGSGSSDGNSSMLLGNFIEHLSNLEMELVNLNDLIVEIGHLVGWSKDFVELKDSFWMAKTFEH